MPRTKKFSELAAPLHADHDRHERIQRETRRIVAGQRLAELRSSRGLTQAQVAEQLGVTQPTISAIESAEDTRLSTILKYVEALGGHVELRAVFDAEQVDLAELVELAGDGARV
jgi:transcriptional regulator with XRE-family HTH domain